MRSFVGSLVVWLVVACCLLVAPPLAHAQATHPRAKQDGDVAVAVFEGKGLGHGVGLPLDGANALALQEESRDDILDRFFPDAAVGGGEGLVRVLLAAREDLEEGIEVSLPDGGTIRDGRTTAVAPSFPLRVPANGRVRLSFSDGFSRAEVLDERSVTGTIEITSTSGTGLGATETPQAPSEADAPGLGASEGSIWVEPRQGGRLVLTPAPGGEERTFRGLTEMVVEAEQLHLVAELDVEDYLGGLDLTLPGDTALEPAALEAATVAARSYALRSARAEPRVGRFHLYSDERSLPYVGDDAPDAARRAARATDGRVIEFDGIPAVALITVSAGGSTAASDEVFGAEQTFPYLPAGEYPGGDAFQWRVDLPLGEVAQRLGYSGIPDSVAVVATTPSGRPANLRMTGDAGPLDVEAAAFHPALRLPSTSFAVHVEQRTETVATRADSPPFQELPGAPLSEAALAAGGKGEADDGYEGRSVPTLVVAIAGISLVVAFAVLLVADVQRRVRAMRERRASRRRHPVDSGQSPAIVALSPATEAARERGPAFDADVPPERELRSEDPVQTPSDGTTEPDGADGAEIAVQATIEGPLWHNEPEWLVDLLPDDAAPAPTPSDDFDEGALRREFDRMRREMTATGPPDAAVIDDEPPATRPLSEILGWDDAPDWLDEPEDTPVDDKGGDDTASP